MLDYGKVTELMCRACHATQPEQRLQVAIIVQSLRDTLLAPACAQAHADRNDARQFFCDGRLEIHADSIGLDPDFVRRLLLRIIRTTAYEQEQALPA